MRVVAEQHAVCCCQCQRVAGGLFPSQVLGTRHQLLRLNFGELSKGTVACLVTPDTLGIREHRVAAVTMFVVAIILVTVDDNLVANFPVLDLVTYGPNDAGRVGTSNVVVLTVDVEGADRNTAAGPNAVVVNASGHNQNQHFVAVQLPCVDNFYLEACLGVAMAFATDGPCVHLFRHVAERGHFADFVQIFFRRVVVRDAGLRIQSHRNLRLVGYVHICRDAESQLIQGKYRPSRNISTRFKAIL